MESRSESIGDIVCGDLGVRIRDIQYRKCVWQFPIALIQAMQAYGARGVDLDEEIDGDVAL